MRAVLYWKKRAEETCGLFALSLTIVLLKAREIEGLVLNGGEGRNVHLPNDLIRSLLLLLLGFVFGFRDILLQARVVLPDHALYLWRGQCLLDWVREGTYCAELADFLRGTHVDKISTQICGRSCAEVVVGRGANCYFGQA